MDADISDSSIILSEKEVPVDQDTVEKALIDTNEIAIHISKENIDIQKNEIKENWDKLAEKSSEESKGEAIRYLSDDYMTYLIMKLNLLICKYCDSPWKHTKHSIRNAKGDVTKLNYIGVLNLFQNNLLIDFIKVYYEYLNCPVDINKNIFDSANREKRNMYLLLGLLYKDYMNIKPISVPYYDKKYTKKET